MTTPERTNTPRETASDANSDTTFVVAVDGPAGSGKSSVSKAAAAALGYAYLDSGACYRALAWSLLDRGVDLEDQGEVIAAQKTIDLRIGTEPSDYFVRVGETDVTEAIREPRVTNAVRHISKVPEVRAGLTALFRRIIRAAPNPGIVVEGRDITTVVASDAPVRILLTASEEARMARRSKELTDQSAAVVGEQLRSRDQADSRVVDFMNAADGVLTLDSTELDFDQTVHAVVEIVHTQTARISHGR